MSVHEQHYPPQTMPRITRLLVNIPARYVVGKVRYTALSSHTKHTQCLCHFFNIVSIANQSGVTSAFLLCSHIHFTHAQN